MDTTGITSLADEEFCIMCKVGTVWLCHMYTIQYRINYSKLHFYQSNVFVAKKREYNCIYCVHKDEQC